MSQKPKEMSKFGERLTYILDQREKKYGKGERKRLADFIGCTGANVTSWTAGRQEPSLLTVLKIARHYRVTVDWLIGGDVTSTAQHAEDRGYAMGLRLAAAWMVDVAEKLHEKADKTAPKQ